MAEYTENLNLIKPAQDEQYDVDDFNDNFDKIDDFAGLTPPRALTADKLTTGAKINGVNFKGDTDIITGLGLYSDTNTYNNTNLAYLYDNGKLRIFQSIQNNNIGHNPLIDTIYWKETQIGQKRNLGEIVKSSLPLTDNTLHLADGSLLSQQNYPEFVSYVANLYNTEFPDVYLYAWYLENDNIVVYTTKEIPEINDLVYLEYPNTTVGTVHSVVPNQYISVLPNTPVPSIYVQFLRDSSRDTYTTGRLKVFATEADWQTSYTTYGECGKYVYDSTNNTVRIPLYNSYFTNTVNPQNLGTLTEASLPNVKGAFNHETTDGVASGAFSIGQSVAGKSSEPGGTADHLIEFNAGNYNSIYKDSAITVNTQSIKQLVYIVVKA